jgi:hypothetical protein
MPVTAGENRAEELQHFAHPDLTDVPQHPK